MILVKKGLWAQPVDPEVLEALFPGKSQHEFRWVACEVRCHEASLLVICVYFWSGQPINSEDNWEIVRQLVCLTGFFRLPVVLFADWQNTPAQVAQAGAFDLLRLQAVMPTGAEFTCNAGSKRMLDYFAISADLSGANLGSDVQTAVPWKTHFAVSLGLKVEVAQIAC